MIEQITNRMNLNRAYRQVLQNKGAAGVDGMEVGALQQHLKSNASTYIQQMQEGCYQVSPILGVNIPKSNGKKRLLGIPTVVDRVTQQAIAQVLQPILRQAFRLTVTVFVQEGMLIRLSNRV